MRVTLVHSPRAGNASSDKDELVAALRRAGYEPVYRSSKAGDLCVGAGRSGGVRRRGGRGWDGGEGGEAACGAERAAGGGAYGDGEQHRECAGGAVGRALGDRAPARAAGDAGGSRGGGGGLGAVGVRGVDRRRLFAEGIAPLEKRPAEEQGGEVKRARWRWWTVLRGCRRGSSRSRLTGRMFRGRYLLVEVMNIRCVGPNLVIAPDAVPGDVLPLDVVIVGEGDAGSWKSIYGAASWGRRIAAVRRGCVAGGGWRWR